MSDNRFPHLIRANGDVRIPNCHPQDSAKIIAWCREIDARCGTTAWFNKVNSRVHFAYGDTDAGILSVAVLVRRTLRLPNTDAVSSDINLTIALNRRSRAEKDRAAASAERSEQHDAEEARHRISEEIVKESIGPAKRLKNKAEMGSHSRPMVTVP